MRVPACICTYACSYIYLYVRVFVSVSVRLRVCLCLFVYMFANVFERLRDTARGFVSVEYRIFE